MQQQTFFKKKHKTGIFGSSKKQIKKKLTVRMPKLTQISIENSKSEPEMRDDSVESKQLQKDNDNTPRNMDQVEQKKKTRISIINLDEIHEFKSLHIMRETFYMSNPRSLGRNLKKKKQDSRISLISRKCNDYSERAKQQLSKLQRLRNDHDEFRIGKIKGLLNSFKGQQRIVKLKKKYEIRKRHLILKGK